MPWVDLHSKQDYASIFYTTNTQYANVGGFDPEKPTVVILHPLFMDSTWLDLQFADARLARSYNMIAFDTRCSGKSDCRPSGRHDSWVDAADLAFCFYHLYLPPAHILALDGLSVNCALRFAVLFPELCLSLTLVSVPSPIELKWIYNAMDELTHGTCFADDIETFQHASSEFIDFLFGPESDPDLKEDLLTYWAEAHPPHLRHRTVELVSTLINRGSLSPEAYASITQPVLVIHASILGFSYSAIAGPRLTYSVVSHPQGEKNDLYPLKYAEKLVAQLTNAQDGAVLYTIKGGTTMLSLVPGNASMMNKVFTNFLSRLPHHRSDLDRPKTPLRDRMRMALKKLAEIGINMDAPSLDPLCSLSFSCLPQEVVKSQSDLIAHYRKNANRAFMPELNLNGHGYGSPGVVGGVTVSIGGTAGGLGGAAGVTTSLSRKSFERKYDAGIQNGKGKLPHVTTKRSKHPSESLESASDLTFTALDSPRISSPATIVGSDDGVGGPGTVGSSTNANAGSGAAVGGGGASGGGGGLPKQKSSTNPFQRLLA